MPGTRMGKMGGLSRRPDWKIGVDRDNEDQVVIKNNWIHSLQEVVIGGLEIDILENIKKARSKDEDIVRIIEEMKKAKVKKLQRNKWQMEEDLVLKERKVYIPKDEELRAEVIQLDHDVLAAGHRRRWKIVELVTRNMEKYMEGCDVC